MKFTLTVTDATADEIAALVAPLESNIQKYLNGMLEEVMKPVYIHDEHGPCQPLQGDAPPAAPVPVPVPVTDDDEGPVNADAPETDKRGYPWDERIHASSKSLNKDGTWRYRRNTPQETIDAVEGELRPVDNTGDYLPAPVIGVTTPAPAPAADPLAIPPFLQRAAEPTPVTVTYEQVIAELTAAMKAGKIAPEALPGFYKACGVADVSGLVGNQDALNKAHEKLGAL